MRPKPDAISQVADEIRNNIQVAIPFGFRRTGWDVAEDKANRRLDFVFVDKQFTDDAFPPGIIDGDGNFEIDSTGVGLVGGTAALSVTLTVAPGKPKWRAAEVALGMALARQTELTKQRGCGVTVVPSRMRWAHRLWSRTSRFDFAWTLAGNVGAFLIDTGVWQPLKENDWSEWFASIRHLYDNRGVSLLRSQKREVAIIDVCARKNAGIHGGGTTAHRPSPSGGQRLPWQCENIPEESSWLMYDIRLNVAADQNKVVHRPAAVANLGQPVGGAQIPGEPYKMRKQDEPEVEQQGYPTQYIVLRWKGLRIHHEPEYPILKSFGGRQVTLLYPNATPKRLWGCFGGCKVWFASATLVYQVVGGYVQQPNDGDYPHDQTLCCS